MKKTRLSACNPYGAWEMKVTYQRNMLYATMVAIGLVAITTFSFWLYGQLAGSPAVERINPKQIVEIFSVLEDIPNIRPDEGAFPAAASQAVADLPPLAIPVPVPDELLADEPEMTIPTNYERDLIVDGLHRSGPPDGSEPGQIGEYGFGGRGDSLDPGPHPDSFQVLQIYPQMVSEHLPKYPEIARRLGLEGSVWLQVLIDTEGRVVKAEILKSSEIEMLDKAALEAAWKNRFSPGIQNNRAVLVWVKYKVEFVLSE